jgi:hypothetical protein
MYSIPVGAPLMLFTGHTIEDVTGDILTSIGGAVPSQPCAIGRGSVTLVLKPSAEIDEKCLLGASWPVGWKPVAWATQYILNVDSDVDHAALQDPVWHVLDGSGPVSLPTCVQLVASMGLDGHLVVDGRCDF